MDHYKSWSALNKQLTDLLCDSLKGRITYFLTYYHQVHNSYGRAAIRLDGKELVCFSWVEMMRQESDVSDRWKETGRYDQDDPVLKEKWDRDGTYCEKDFLQAVTAYLSMSAADALESEDYLLKILAVMDRRVGKRSLRRMREKGGFEGYPQWAGQFFDLRFAVEQID